MTSRCKRQRKALRWWRYLCKIQPSRSTPGAEASYNWSVHDRNNRNWARVK